MNMKDFFQQIGGRFKKDKDRQELPDEVVAGFLRVLEEVRVEEMPCSEVFSRLDEYVEKELDGQDPGKLRPLLREHFDLCPDCCEEYESLLTMLEHAAKDKGT
jgi:hypothetical protein